MGAITILSCPRRPERSSQNGIKISTDDFFGPRNTPFAGAFYNCMNSFLNEEPLKTVANFPQSDQNIIRNLRRLLPSQNSAAYGQSLSLIVMAFLTPECLFHRLFQSFVSRMRVNRFIHLPRVTGQARAEYNKNKLIIKYPEWYDRFHERGYGVVRETREFDVTWIGTETRDPDNERWGMKPQYGAYWLSQWTAAFSGEKFGGGWFDPLGTTPKTYVEQACQTILGQCPESMLFCYGALHRDHGPDNVKALRPQIPGLIDLAAFVKGETARGVGSYKPPNSDAGEDFYIFNFIGMLGVPMTAGVEFPDAAPSLFLTRHALADPSLETKLKAAIKEKKPALLTSNLLANLPSKIADRLKAAPEVRVLDLEPNAKGKKSFYGVLTSVRELRNLPTERVDALRAPLLKPLGIDLSAPTGVALYLYGEDKAVVENFNDEDAEIRLSIRGAKRYEKAVVLPQKAEIKIQTGKKGVRITLPARSMLALRLR